MAVSTPWMAACSAISERGLEDEGAGNQRVGREIEQQRTAAVAAA